MNIGKTLFAQIMELVPWTSFTHTGHIRNVRAIASSCTRGGNGAGGSAFALWHLVEKRFLRRASHYVIATSGLLAE